MFTYLGLVAAWLHYRNHAHDDERVEADETRQGEAVAGRCDHTDELEESDAESNLSDIISIENDFVFGDDCFEQVPRFERETQTDRITAVVNTSTLQTKAGNEEFDSHEPFDPLGIIKDNNFVNNKRDLSAIIDPEGSRKILYASQVIENGVLEKSRNNFDSHVSEIHRSESDNVLTHAECIPDSFDFSSSFKPLKNDDERWRMYEQEIEKGFLSSDCSNEYDEYMNYGNEDVKNNGVSDIVSRESLSIPDLADPVQKLGDIENNMENDSQKKHLQNANEKSEECLGDISEVKYVGENFIRCNRDDEGEVIIHGSNEGSEIDLEKSGDHTINVNRFESMIDPVQICDFADPLIGITAHENVIEGAEGELISYEVPRLYGEVVNSYDQGLLSTNLEKFDDACCGLGDSELNSVEFEDNVTKDGGDDVGIEHTDFDVHNKWSKVSEEAFADSCEDKQSVDLTNRNKSPPAADDQKSFSDVSGSICKQFDPSGGCTGANENEAESISDGQCDVNDGYNERLKGVIDDISELTEANSIVGDIQSEVYDGGLCEEKISDSLSEISNAIEDDYEAIESEAKDSGSSYSNSHGTSDTQGAVDKRVNISSSLENEDPEKATLYSPDAEEHEKKYKVKGLSVEVFDRDWRKDEEWKLKDDMEERYAVEERKGEYINEKEYDANDCDDAVDCNMTENFHYRFTEEQEVKNDCEEVLIETANESKGMLSEKESVTFDDGGEKYSKVREDANEDANEDDGFTTCNEGKSDGENVMLTNRLNEEIHCKFDDLFDTEANNSTQEVGKDKENFSCPRTCDKDNSEYRCTVSEVEESLKEDFIEGEQSIAFSWEDDYIDNVEISDIALSDEEKLRQEIDKTEICFMEMEDESEESSESFIDIDYELLVSSGAESVEDSDEETFHDRINESKVYTNGNIDVRANMTVLETINEVEESESDVEIYANSPTIAKEDFCQTLSLREGERVDRRALMNSESSFHIHINMREVELALSCYAKNERFLRYFGNLLLNPGVFVDVFNNVPFQLHCKTHKVDRIAELNDEKLSPRLDLGLIATNRDSYFAKGICKIAGDIDYHFNSFKKDCERGRGYVILPGCFGISYTKRSHYNEFGELAPIVCDSNPTLDADTAHVDGDNAFSCEVLHPAINFEDSNKFDSDQTLRTKPTHAFQCNRDINDYVFLTTLASVDNESASDSGSNLASSSEYLEGEAVTFIDFDELKAESKRSVFPTDGTLKQFQLKRSVELDEDIEQQLSPSLFETKTIPVSPSKFDIPFEGNYELSDYEKRFCEYEDAVIDLDPHTSEPESKSLNFDLLLSEASPLTDLKSEDFAVPLFESTLHSEENLQEFETETKGVDESQTLDMGQVQGVGFIKGTLAMPISNQSLRGVTIRNHGDYAVIHYKNTRFAPLISVDKRIEITMTVPKQNSISHDKKFDRRSREDNKSNDLHSEGNVDIKTNQSIDVEVLNEFLRHPVVIGDGVKKPAGPYFGGKNELDSISNTDVQTTPSYESSIIFTNRSDKIAKIAQHFGETSFQQELVGEDKTFILDDKFLEKLIMMQCDENMVVGPILEEIKEGEYCEGKTGTEDLKKDSEEHGNAVEEHKAINVNVRALRCPEYDAIKTTCNDNDTEVSLNDLQFKGLLVVTEPKSSKTKEACNYYDRESTANEFAVRIVTPGYNRVKDEGSNNDFQNAVSSSCFGDFGVTNPDIDNEQIQSVEDIVFQVAVNEREDLSATDSQHEVLLLEDDKIIDRTQKDLLQRLSFDGFQAEVKNESADTAVEVNNEHLIENEGTKDLIAVPKYNRVRSKSLPSLLEGLFESMSWFYRDRPSSVCFDNENLKANTYGALRRTKSAEISRRKPKIRLSTNFERRPIKETNLDELIKSLEYLGPRRGEVVPDKQNAYKAMLENDEKEIAHAKGLFEDTSGKNSGKMSKARSISLPVSDGKHNEQRYNEPVAVLAKTFESPPKSPRKIVVETKRIIKQEPHLRSTLSDNIGKNLKHLNGANKIVGSLDENNNNKSDQKNRTFSNESNHVPASFGVYELRNQSFMTDRKEHVEQQHSLEQQPDTKAELHAALNTNREDKASKSGTVKCNLDEDKPHMIYKKHRTSNSISNLIKQLTGNGAESKAISSSDLKEKADLTTEINSSEQKTLELPSIANEEEVKRSSVYGFTVFLSESSQYDSTDFDVKPEEGVAVTPSSKQDHFWMQQKDGCDGDGNSGEKVSDIDLVLKTTFQSSLENLDGLDENVSKARCSNCDAAVDSSLNSTTSICDNCKEKKDLHKQRSHEKPRSRSSFRKDKRLRKWLEVRQSSMNSEDKVILDKMNVDDQSRLLKKVALSKGIDYNEEDDTKKKRHTSLRSRQFDFLEQLRYLINFEDDDYNERIRGLEVSEKEHDAIELLREYEASRQQLKKGKSPMVSDDEGNDSDAFTDITDTTFSDYVRSRQSLNSLLLSQGSLYKSESLDLAAEDVNHGSLDKDFAWKSADFVDANILRSTPRDRSGFDRSGFGRSASLGKETKSMENMPIERNTEEVLQEASISNLSHQPEVNESVEKMVAAELFSMDDMNGLISQGNSAVRSRRGRAQKHDVLRPVLNLAVNDGTEREPSWQPVNMNLDNVFIENAEANGITANLVDISRPLPAHRIINMRNLTEQQIYADSPCSILTERLNDASYENLRLKLMNRPYAISKESWLHGGRESTNKSLSPGYSIGSLRSPLIRKLNGSPQQKRRATSLREISTDHRTPSGQSRSFHSVPTSPPRLLRESPHRKSTGSYDQRKKEFRSLPDLVVQPESGLASPIKSICSSGGSSTLSLQQSSPRLPISSLPRSRSSLPNSRRRSPIRSPMRSPRLSELEDELADTETVISDHTAFFSDSSIDIGMAQDGYEVDDEDFFLPNSMLDRSFSQNFDDFLAQDSDGASSGEYFVPLNTRSKRPESRVISCAFGPCKNMDFVDWSQRSRFTSCVSCFTYYCSKECRKAHWGEHKLTCYYGRINYYTKALVRRFETNKNVNENLSRLALEGFHESGRGCVLISFSSPIAAKFFLVSGTNSFVNDPSYVSLDEVLNEGIVTKHQVLLQQTLQDYNPEVEFVANLTVYVGKQNEMQASNRSRFKSSALLRCAKIPLNSIFLSTEVDSFPETSYDIKVFYLPRSKNHHFINETEARRYYCREVSYGLRKYGVVLKRDYPEAYDKLCLYVEHDVKFVPITLYGQSNGNNYKCVVFPEGFSSSSAALELEGRGMLV